MQLHSDISKGCTHLKARLGLEHQPPRWPTHRAAGWWGEAAVPLWVDPPMGLLGGPQDMVASFPMSK